MKITRHGGLEETPHYKISGPGYTVEVIQVEGQWLVSRQFDHQLDIEALAEFGRALMYSSEAVIQLSNSPERKRTMLDVMQHALEHPIDPD